VLAGVCVSVGAMVGVRSGVSAWAVGVPVTGCVGRVARRAAMPASCGLALPQTYDDIEQHAQATQYTKMMIA
jgi:hypothetical protein